MGGLAVKRKFLKFRAIIFRGCIFSFPAESGEAETQRGRKCLVKIDFWGEDISPCLLLLPLMHEFKLGYLLRNIKAGLPGGEVRWVSWM
jgi:hypothetical protein